MHMQCLSCQASLQTETIAVCRLACWHSDITVTVLCCSAVKFPRRKILTTFCSRCCMIHSWIGYQMRFRSTKLFTKSWWYNFNWPDLTCISLEKSCPPQIMEIIATSDWYLGHNKKNVIRFIQDLSRTAKLASITFPDQELRMSFRFSSFAFLVLAHVNSNVSNGLS